MTWLIRLYPTRWRQRYGSELEQLVSDLRPTTSRTGLAIDLAKGALDAHIPERLGMRAVERKAIGRGALVAAIV